MKNHTELCSRRMKENGSLRNLIFIALESASSDFRLIDVRLDLCFQCRLQIQLNSSLNFQVDPSNSLEIQSWEVTRSKGTRPVAHIFG